MLYTMLYMMLYIMLHICYTQCNTWKIHGAMSAGNIINVLVALLAIPDIIVALLTIMRSLPKLFQHSIYVLFWSIMILYRVTTYWTAHFITFSSISYIETHPNEYGRLVEYRLYVTADRPGAGLYHIKSSLLYVAQLMVTSSWGHTLL